MTAETERLKALIDLVAQENIAELQLVEAGIEYHVVLRDPAPAHQPAGAHPGAAEPPRELIASSGAPAAAPGLHTVTAPMPGMFYRAAGAGGKPLVELGARVEVGIPLGIVEAMKILNEVAADRAGTVVRIAMEDGQTVEQGQALFLIEPGA